MNYDLHQLHNARNEDFARRLFDALPAMCGGLGDLGQALESDAGRPPLRANPAQGRTEPGSDIASREIASNQPLGLDIRASVAIETVAEQQGQTA